jgi:transcriptional regulator with XRE-family HTH domain
MVSTTPSSRLADSSSPLDDRQELGARLRASRLRTSRSLRAVAGEVGISPSALSQIERGQSRPSVPTLYSIVNCLGITLDELFDGASQETAPTPEVVSRTSSGPVSTPADRHVITLDSGVQWQQLTADVTPGVDFLRLVYQPGGSSSSNQSFVRHDGHEFGIVESGRLRVTLGFQAYELGPGDSISFHSSTPHRLETIGDEPAYAIWFILSESLGVPRTQASGGHLEN